MANASFRKAIMNTYLYFRFGAFVNGQIWTARTCPIDRLPVRVEDRVRTEWQFNKTGVRGCGAERVRGQECPRHALLFLRAGGQAVCAPALRDSVLPDFVEQRFVADFQ